MQNKRDERQLKEQEHIDVIVGLSAMMKERGVKQTLFIFSQNYPKQFLEMQQLMHLYHPSK